MTTTRPWVTLTLGDAMPLFGEGVTQDDALRDLVRTMKTIHDGLHGHSDAALAEHLRHERAFLCALLDTDDKAEGLT